MNNALKSALENFQQKENDLLVAGKPLRDIVGEEASPTYLYDRSLLRRRSRQLHQALPQELHIDYAVKANPNIDIMRICSELYDGFDIASAGEMRRAMSAGIAPGRMGFAGPGKSPQELKFAVDNNIGRISVENELELKRLHDIGASLQKQIDVLIRVNPDFELASSGMKMGGGARQFGIDSEEAPKLIHQLKKNERLNFRGIHIYSGSQNLRAEAIVSSFEKIIDYAISLSKLAATPIDFVNLGGGFGIPYFANDADLDLNTVGQETHRLLKRAKAYLPGTQFNIELGRYIVGECGLYVSRVLYRKISRDQVFIITNGGMHHHLAASGNFGQKMVHRPMPMTIATAMNNPLEKVNVVGPLCTPLDTFGMNVELPRSTEDDLLVVFNSGAYGYSASPQAFLSHDPPAEIIL